MEKTTKVAAIKRLLEEESGSADWATIYEKIEKYYKGVKSSDYWQEGIRGVVYREQRYGRNFKVSKGVVSLV